MPADKGIINEHELVKIKNNYVVGIDCIPFLHCKKRLVIFPSQAEISLTKLSLAGNKSPAKMSLTLLSLAGINLIIPGQGQFSSDLGYGQFSLDPG